MKKKRRLQQYSRLSCTTYATQASTIGFQDFRLVLAAVCAMMHKLLHDSCNFSPVESIVTMVLPLPISVWILISGHPWQQAFLAAHDGPSGPADQ